MEILIYVMLRMILITLSVAAAVYIAIKYDKYEKYISCYFIYKVSPLVKDPVDAEWEFVRKQRRFEYVYAEEMEKYQEGSTFDIHEYTNEGTSYERCA